MGAMNLRLPDQPGEPTIRREPRPGDLDAIVAHHIETYLPEFGVDGTFGEHVAAAVAAISKTDFPSESERLWIVERDGRHCGSLALTDDGDGAGVVRWFVLDRDVRGFGLGRRLLRELLSEARELGYERLWLETFSDLRAAAHLYTSNGFELVSEDIGPRWGRERIGYRRYELTFQARAQSSSWDSTGSSARPFSVSA